MNSNQELYQNVAKVMTLLKEFNHIELKLTQDKIRILSELEYDISLCESVDKFDFKTIKIEGDLSALTLEKRILLKETLASHKIKVEQFFQKRMGDLENQRINFKKQMELSGCSVFYETAKAMVEQFNF